MVNVSGRSRDSLHRRDADIAAMGALGSGRDRVLMTGIGLHMPAGLTFDEWERAGRQLSGIVDSSAWWLGDWLVFGKTRYPDRYQRAIRAAGLRYQTLRNYAWVARRFELDRRRETLTFQHHAEVASLSVEDQDRLLAQAESARWTTKQLRKAMRDQLVGNSEHNEVLVVVNSHIAVADDRLTRWRAAAQSLGIDFDRWMWLMLDRAAEEVLSDDSE